MTANNCKFLDILGKIMILAVAEGKRLNLGLSRMLFRVVLGANTRSDVTILDLLRMFPNDHYLALMFRLLNIQRFLEKINLYSSVFQCGHKMDVEDGGDGEDVDCGGDRGGDSKSSYSRKGVVRLREQCKSFVDVMGLTMNSPTLNVPLSDNQLSGEDVEPLTVDNLQRYLVSISNLFINDGIFTSNRRLQCGLESVLQRDCRFLPFYDYELESMVTGSSSQHFDEWTAKYLGKFVKLEQFTKQSPVIRNLFDVLCHFDIKKKRQFIFSDSDSRRIHFQ